MSKIRLNKTSKAASKIKSDKKISDIARDQRAKQRDIIRNIENENEELKRQLDEKNRIINVLQVHFQLLVKVTRLFGITINGWANYLNPRAVQVHDLAGNNYNLTPVFKIQHMNQNINEAMSAQHGRPADSFFNSNRLWQNGAAPSFSEVEQAQENGNQINVLF